MVAGVDNRSVFAKKRFPANRVILAVPKANMLSLKVAREESDVCLKMDAARHAQNLNLLSPNHCFLAVFMLGDTGRFKAYCDSLPKDLSSMPVFWTPQELLLLKGSPILQKVEDRKVVASLYLIFCSIHDDKINFRAISCQMSIQCDYEEIIRVAPEFADLASLEEFTTKRMLVNSRVFATTIDGIEVNYLCH